MSDVNCPYCDEELEINHDDGYGYDQDETHNQECSNCNKVFTYTTRIMFHYSVSKSFCLNGGEHSWKASNTVPRIATTMYCDDCGETRRPTEIEWEVINSNK